MRRPCCLRHIDVNPCAVYFKPSGIPFQMLEEAILSLDELPGSVILPPDARQDKPVATRPRAGRCGGRVHGK